MVLLLLSLLALAPAASSAVASGPVAGERMDRSGVRAYWTPERMRAAEPLDPQRPDARAGGGGPSAPQGEPLVVAPAEAGSPEVADLATTTLSSQPTTRDAAIDRDEITNPAAAEYRSHGKVFLTITGGSAPGDYVCSGTAVSSNNRSVVWSAGHCVFDTEGGGFASNWMFAPGYKNGATPFGEWVAEKLETTKPWRENGNLSYDLGAAQVGENAEGQSLTDLVGGTGIGFNQPRSQAYESYGYPAQQPPFEFTGGREFRCTAALGGSDDPPGGGPNTMFIPCDMSGGSSGGGWVAGDTLLSVNSYSYCIAGVISCEQRLYGPYMDDTAQQLYESIAGDAVFCGGEKVTLLGTSGADKLVGTSGDDVIKALGGGDEIKAEGGNDLVCAGDGKDAVKGGNGKDKLQGQKGKDQLYGQNGKDNLVGGDGNDFCNGGDGKDKASSCKTKKNIP